MQRIAQASVDPNLKAVARRSLEALGEHFSLQAADIKLLDTRTGSLRLLDSFGYPRKAVERMQRLQLDQSDYLHQQAIRQRRLLTNRDEQLTPAREKELREAGLFGRRYLIAPIIAGDSVAGSLSLVFRGARDSFSPLELGIVQSVNQILARAFENNQLLAYLQNELSRTKLLQRIAAIGSREADIELICESMLDAIQAQIGLRTGGVLLMKDGGRTTLAAGYGLTEPFSKRLETLTTRSTSFLMVRAMKENRVLTHEDEVMTARRRRIIREAGIEDCRYLALPIGHGGRVSAVAFLAFPGRRSFEPAEVNLFDAVGRLLGQAMDRARLFSSLEHELARTRILQEVALAAGSEPDLMAIAARLLETLSRHLPIKVADIQVLDASRQILRMLASTGYSEAIAEELREIPADAKDFLPARVIREGRLITNAEDAATAGRKRVLRQLGITSSSYFSAPIAYRGDILGVLSIAFEKNFDLGERELELARSVTSIIGQAFDNARLFSDERQHSALATYLNRINWEMASTKEPDEVMQIAVTWGRSAFGADSGSIVLCQDGGWVTAFIDGSLPPEMLGRRLTAAEEKVLDSIRTREPLPVTDYAHQRGFSARLAGKYGLRASMIVPVLEKSQKISAFLFFNYQREHHFSEAISDFASKLSSSVSLALQNARLYQEEKLMAGLKESLNRIDAALASLLDEQAIMDLVTKEGGLAIGADSAGMCCHEGDEWVTCSDWNLGIPAGSRFRADQVPLAEEAAGSRRPMIVKDVRTDGRINRALARKLPVRSFMLVPIVLRDNRPRLLFFNHREAVAGFNDAQLDFAARLSSAAALALENAQLFKAQEAARRQAADELEISNTFLQAAGVLTESLDLEMVLDRFIQMIQRVIPGTRVVVFLFDEEQDRVSAVAGAGGDWPAGRSYAFEELSPVHLLMRQKKQPLVYDFDAAARAEKSVAAARRQKARLNAFFPLIVKDSVIGDLSVDIPGKRHDFSSRELKLLAGIAAQAAVIIDNARLFEAQVEAKRAGQHELEMTNMFLEAADILSESLDLQDVLQALVRVALRVVSGSRVAVSLYDLRRNLVSVEATGGPQAVDTRQYPLERLSRLYVKLMQTQQTVIEDYSEEKLPRLSRDIIQKFNVVKAAVVPLIASGGIIGDIYIDIPGEAHDFTEREIELLEGIASQASVIVENAQLHQRTLQRSQTLEAMLQMGNLLTASMRVAEVRAQIVDYARVLTDTPAVMLLMLDAGQKNLVVVASEGIAPPVSKSTMSVDRFRELHFDRPTPAVIDDISSLRQAPVFSRNKQSGYTSAIVMPLFMQGKLRGAVAVFDSQRLEPADEQLVALRLFCTQAASGIKNAELFEKELKIAETLQKSLLPGIAPRIRGLEVRFFYNSASSGAEVGGDFYDFLDLGEGLYGIVVGDVSGKGIEAATETARVKFLLRDRLSSGLSATQAIESVNEALYRQVTERFTALTYCQYKVATGEIAVVNCGNPYPYLAREDRFLEKSGVLLSVVKDAVYSASHKVLRRGDTLLMYTDGLTEARRRGRMFGSRGMRSYVRGNSALPLAALLRGLADEARQFGGGALADDLVIVGIRKR